MFALGSRSTQELQVRPKVPPRYPRSGSRCLTARGQPSARVYRKVYPSWLPCHESRPLGAHKPHRHLRLDVRTQAPGHLPAAPHGQRKIHRGRLIHRTTCFCYVLQCRTATHSSCRDPSCRSRSGPGIWRMSVNRSPGHLLVSRASFPLSPSTLWPRRMAIACRHLIRVRGAPYTVQMLDTDRSRAVNFGCSAAEDRLE
jgi:hypothetical protein